MKRSIAILAIFATGCANYQPIVDTQGVDMARYDADLVACQRYAGQVDPASHAAAGAVGGAILGAVIGALVGGRSGAGAGAGIYGATGAGIGAGDGMAAQRNIVRKCMAGRGYRVLH